MTFPFDDEFCNTVGFDDLSDVQAGDIAIYLANNNSPLLSVFLVHYPFEKIRYRCFMLDPCGGYLKHDFAICTRWSIESLAWILARKAHVGPYLSCLYRALRGLDDCTLFYSRRLIQHMIDVGLQTAERKPLFTVALLTAYKTCEFCKELNAELRVAHALFNRCQRALVTGWIPFYKARVSDIAIALQSLHLPALLVLAICDALNPVVARIPMHLKWDAIAKVKHF